MLQRDYIQRLIREFMAALERMLEKKEVEVRREKIRELYDQYVGPYAFYSIATIDDVMKAMAGIADEEKRLSKMDMLAELYYHEADTVGQPTRDELLGKAFNGAAGNSGFGGTLSASSAGTRQLRAANCA